MPQVGAPAIDGGDTWQRQDLLMMRASGPLVVEEIALLGAIQLTTAPRRMSFFQVQQTP